MVHAETVNGRARVIVFGNTVTPREVERLMTLIFGGSGRERGGEDWSRSKVDGHCTDYGHVFAAVGTEHSPHPHIPTPHSCLPPPASVIFPFGQ